MRAMNKLAKTLQKAAWQSQKEWHDKLANEICASKLRSGRAMTKSKKLHRIKAILVDNKPVHGAVAAERVAHAFANKWECHRLARLERIATFVDACSDPAHFCTERAISQALLPLKDVRNLAGMCMSAAALKLVHHARPDFVVKAFCDFLTLRVDSIPCIAHLYISHVSGYKHWGLLRVRC